MITDVVRDAFEVMGKGMLSIFVVVFILTLIVSLLTKVTNMKIFRKDEPETEE